MIRKKKRLLIIGVKVNLNRLILRITHVIGKKRMIAQNQKITIESKPTSTTTLDPAPKGKEDEFKSD